MISRALSIKAVPRGEDEEEYLKSMAHRRTLRLKLLIYFGLGLVANCINLCSFVMARFIFKQYFVEFNLINACGLAAYPILNLYLLDVLRDGVLNPPTVNSSRVSRLAKTEISRANALGIRIDHAPRSNRLSNA
jgi:hypothetical protein